MNEAECRNDEYKMIIEGRMLKLTNERFRSGLAELSRRRIRITIMIKIRE